MVIPVAIKPGFYKSLWKVLEARYPAELKLWDRYDYKIYAPISLDDEARIEVHLRSQDGRVQKLVLAI